MSSLTSTKRPRDDSEDGSLGGPAKRERLEGAAPDGLSAVAPLKKDEEFWFEDGNITLVVGDIEFRIYRGLLIEQSEVFRDMFSLAQPSSQPHESPEPPVVHLYDPPDSFRHLLRAFMSGKGTTVSDTGNPSFEAIWARIHLGNKYHMTKVQEQAVAFLKAHFTTDLKRWDKLDAWVPDGWEHEQVIGVVNLARFIDEPTILPTALLGCVALGGDLVRGFGRADGGQETLSTDDVALCIVAASRIIVENNMACIEILAVIGPLCEADGYQRIYVRHWRSGGETSARLLKVKEELVTQIANPLVKMSTLLAPNEVNHCYCCHHEVESWDAEHRRRMWDCLPELLDIKVPGWNAADDNDSLIVNESDSDEESNNG
ncbi:hypothetical protein L226DRAFT_148024 [Lentinus tigrinus ALCF2SS1-7]|uniref:BTB domain-containing protein n=1 Tax=Lentinus tigrinus ALCF2SS1-6 TaxID=1328759 RepID=A0A5C2S4F1_9APHY|nr:hypothetical protein L227DRAFT_179786 [Lentinus tigrinus ALCF2SS1-6]RPD72833.1 hypothetical protein L226DRAFT_148024 [Lentinus tigrinus ALCF2SS1-7]